MTILPKTQPRVTWWLTVLVYMKEIQQIVLTLRSTRLLFVERHRTSNTGNTGRPRQKPCMVIFRKLRGLQVGLVGLHGSLVDHTFLTCKAMQCIGVILVQVGTGKMGICWAEKTQKTLVSWMNWAESWGWSLSETCRLSSDMLVQVQLVEGQVGQVVNKKILLHSELKIRHLCFFFQLTASPGPAWGYGQHVPPRVQVPQASRGDFSDHVLSVWWVFFTWCAMCWWSIAFNWFELQPFG